MPKLKTIHDAALRGGLCAVWVAGVLLCFYNGAIAAALSPDDPEVSKLAIRALVCGCAAIAAAFAHAHLIREALEKSDGA
jgi:hypothetical protein